MATIVTFHAHPDDEAIQTAGVTARAVAQGHRVILVSATRGEHGEVEEGFLRENESLASRRETELSNAGTILGASRVEFLGYVDSGMMGTPENDLPGSFWSADVEEAAQRLAQILREENADILTIYDPDGTYGHPDHIQVHRVGVRAAQLAGTRKVYEAVVPRERVVAELQAMSDEEMEGPGEIDPETFGVPEATITTIVDVTDHIDVKRAAMRAHQSQIPESSFFLALPDEPFATFFGTEYFRLIGAPEGTQESDLFGGI